MYMHGKKVSGGRMGVVAGIRYFKGLMMALHMVTLG